MLDDVFIMAGARTAVGSFGGSLKSISAAKLGEITIREAVARSGIPTEAVENVVLGNVIPSRPEDAYIARVAAVNAGLPIAAPALTVNRLCGSGLQAIISAAQGLTLGEFGVAVAGGAENMSQAPFHVIDSRFGKRMGDAAMLDALVRTLSDPFEGVHMGITAENVAEEASVSRVEQDAVAFESQRRAAFAIEQGRFEDQIVPVEIMTSKGPVVFSRDEQVRPETSLKSLSALRPAFRKEGSVTAGNASSINDGSAAVVLATKAAADRYGLRPLARIVGWATAGIEPRLMGLGPVMAVPIALAQAGLSLSDIDVIEANEAFAAQACAVAHQLKFDPAKTNVNGSGIALGHPIGATGAILTIKLLYELRRIKGRYGLVTMCIGGGQGIALIIEALP